MVSIAGNAFVSLLKFVAGTMFGSIALIADALHSSTDIVASVAVFLGVRFSETKSEKFPYGLYKMENLVSLFIALVIFYTGIEIALESAGKLLAPIAIGNATAIAAAAVSLLIVFALAKYKERVAKEERSPSMLSEAKHSMLDAYGSVSFVAAVALSFAGFPIADPLIGLVIAVLVFKAGAGIFLDSVKVLLDISLDYKTMRKIEKIAAGQRGLVVKELIARNSGRYVFVDLKLETDIKDLKRVSQLHQQCEEKIKQAIPGIDKIMIDVEYKKKDVLTYAVALEGKSRESPIAMEFGTAKFFGLFRVTNKPGEEKKLIGSRVVANPYAKSQSKRGILAAELLAKNKVDALFSKGEMHKGGAYYAMQEKFIETKRTDKKTFKELLNEFR